MNISITREVQEKIERNRSLLNPLNSVINKLEHSDENEHRYGYRSSESRVSDLSSDVSVIRQGNIRVYFTRYGEHIVILDID
ncbi:MULTISPECIES: hypothetical protein [Acinetobacter]|uniref:hypothetical protein n=1 Tax=Acinetobacter TaxID=469 RepID=UPI002005C4E6|nr:MULTISPECIES: hypothetical protein [Acinetobacter]MCK4103401.1 hypothetical protein [Acinetobacter radioresistens]